MSDLSHTVTAGAATGELPLVAGLRQRHAKLSAKDGRAKPFELRLPDRTAHSIGGRRRAGLHRPDRHRGGPCRHGGVRRAESGRGVYGRRSRHRRRPADGAQAAARARRSPPPQIPLFDLRRARSLRPGRTRQEVDQEPLRRRSQLLPSLAGQITAGLLARVLRRRRRVSGGRDGTQVPLRLRRLRHQARPSGARHRRRAGGHSFSSPASRAFT